MRTLQVYRAPLFMNMYLWSWEVQIYAVIHTGRGIPPLYDHLINTPRVSDTEEDDETELSPHWEYLKTISAQWNDPKSINYTMTSVISILWCGINFTHTSDVAAFKTFSEEVLGLKEYEVSHGPGAGHSLDPQHDDEGVELGAMDKYVQGIILHREVIAEECLNIRKQCVNAYR